MSRGKGVAYVRDDTGRTWSYPGAAPFLAHKKYHPFLRGGIFRLSVDTDEYPLGTVTAKAKVLIAIAAGDGVDHLLAPAGADVDAAVDKIVDAACPLHALRCRAHVAAKAEGGYGYWNVNGLVHSILSYD